MSLGAQSFRNLRDAAGIFWIHFPARLKRAPKRRDFRSSFGFGFGAHGPGRGPAGVAGQSGAAGHVGAAGAAGTASGARGSDLKDTNSGGIFISGGKLGIVANDCPRVSNCSQIFRGIETECCGSTQSTGSGAIQRCAMSLRAILNQYDVLPTKNR